MPEYLAPGVFIEEVPARLKAIEGVSTSTAAFVGRASRGPVPAMTSRIESRGSISLAIRNASTTCSARFSGANTRSANSGVGP